MKTASDAGGRIGTAVLALLAVDGVLSAVAGALLLPLYLGPVPFPVSALASGLLNVLVAHRSRRGNSGSRFGRAQLRSR